MADSAILAAGGNDAPLSYLVPGASAIRIKQIHVAYVDNGAAGDWLPAVRIVSDSSHKMGTASDQGVKVTAGSDADVSFFPGVKHAASASAATDTSWAILDRTVVQSCASGVTQGISMDGSTTGYFHTNDAGRFAVSTYTAGTFNGMSGLRVITPGLYEIIFSVNLSISGAANLHKLVSAIESVGGQAFLGNMLPWHNELQYFTDASQPSTKALFWTTFYEIEADIGNTPFIPTVFQATGVSGNARAGIFARVVNSTPLGTGSNF